MKFTKTYKLSEIISSNIKSVAIFEKYEINYCANGNMTLTDACESINVRPAMLLSELNKLNGTCSNLLKVNEWKLDFLCDYITSNHHIYIRKTFSALLKQFKKIIVSQGRDDTLNEFEQLRKDFEIHMQKEEKLLFPYIKRLVDSENSKTEFEIAPFGLIKKPIIVMKKEHALAYAKLKRLKQICKEISRVKTESSLKNDICKLFDEFEYDFHIHIHLENNLLFPKALLLERKILKNKSISKLNI